MNPLVNAMSVGMVKIGETISATSYGAGNPVFIVGSSTGKDGIHGAAFASKDITEDSAKIYLPFKWVTHFRKNYYWKLLWK